MLGELLNIADSTTLLRVNIVQVTETRVNEDEDEAEVDLEVVPISFTLGQVVRAYGAGNSSGTTPKKIFKTPSVSDMTYRNYDKSEQFLDVRPGGHYYFRISVIDKAIRKKEELDGEVEFYRRYETPIELEEDAYFPIPNMSIFNYDFIHP
ncbi:MAG: hypothetical protein HC913_23130 [Microscillaceae bacterium]|nr:hypothetical protein [Microscillaceae bacterium]